MWPALVIRLLKRRSVFIIPAIVLVLYLFIRLLIQSNSFHILESKDYFAGRTKPLIWRTLQEHLLTDDVNNRTNAPNVMCRNSMQGKQLLTDDRGFVCNRIHLLANGCCDVEIPQTQYYTCRSCNASNHCCDIYEYCVSCCLHPGKRPILESALEFIKDRQAMVYAQVADQFELCLVKCRTNSHSVVHENRYRDDKSKYCYGPTQAHESQRDVSGLIT